MVNILPCPLSQPERQGSVLLNSMLQLTTQYHDRSRKQPLFHFGFSCTSDLDFPAQYSNFCCLYIDTLSQSQTLGLRKGRARASSNIPSLTFMERMLLLSVGFWDDRLFFLFLLDQFECKTHRLFFCVCGFSRQGFLCLALESVLDLIV